MPVKSAAKTKTASNARTPVDGDDASKGATLPARTSQARRKCVRPEALPQLMEQPVQQTAKGELADKSVPSAPNASTAKKRRHAGGSADAGTPLATSDASANVERQAAIIPSLSKAQQVLALLRGDGGATLLELQAATGWQAHSVRGFLSGTVRKRMGLALTLQPDDAGARRYALAKG